jgi:tetratricopeptide (TPR) repeat protein
VVRCLGESTCKFKEGKYSYNSCCRGDTCKPDLAGSRRRKDPGDIIHRSRHDLPEGEATDLAAVEQGIEQLGLDERVKYFVLADLYAAWNLTETLPILDRLFDFLSREENMANGRFRYLLLPTGNLCRQFGRNDKAEQLYERNIAISKRYGDILEQADTNVALAKIYRDRGDTLKADQNILNAKTLYKEAGITKINLDKQ